MKKKKKDSEFFVFTHTHSQGNASDSQNPIWHTLQSLFLLPFHGKFLSRKFSHDERWNLDIFLMIFNMKNEDI